MRREKTRTLPQLSSFINQAFSRPISEPIKLPSSAAQHRRRLWTMFISSLAIAAISLTAGWYFGTRDGFTTEGSLVTILPLPPERAVSR